MAIAVRNSTSNTGEGTASPATITIPTGSTTGDIMLAFVVSASATTQSHSTPSGWTVLDDFQQSGSGLFTRITVYYRFWQSGDANASVTITGMSGTGSWVTQSIAYSGVFSVTGNSAAGSTTTSASHTTPTATSSLSGLWRISAFAGLRSSPDATFSSYNPADTERGDNAATAGSFRAHCAIADSNGVINASSGTSVSATSDQTLAQPARWIGLLRPNATDASAGTVTATVAAENGRFIGSPVAAATAYSASVRAKPNAQLVTASVGANSVSAGSLVSVMTTTNEAKPIVGARAQIIG
jgi:hypothetical protein